ncbi:rubrerythrin family protein, partial [Mediterraneibacter gnavus]
MHAFAGESQARNRYTYYASIAKKEGFVQIQNIFLETANQEKEHAKRLMKLMNKDLAGETLYTDGNFPVLLGTTAENLKAAAAGENEEYTDMYP